MGQTLNQYFIETLSTFLSLYQTCLDGLQLNQTKVIQNDQ